MSGRTLPSVACSSAPSRFDRTSRAAAIFAVLSAMTLVVLDAGVANIALPSLGRALDDAPSAAILIVTTYLQLTAR